MNLLKRFLEHRRLPVVLAIGAVLVMLPAVNTGLFGDDLPQRVIQYRPDQLPPNIRDTGNPADTGSFGEVINGLFFNRSDADIKRMAGYGMLPWWVTDNLRIGLWRPLTALTHWLDYRLYPDSPALMHLQNIAWYAAILFVLTLNYRRIMGAAWPAGFAALLFLLDGNTFFPVAFVANRGFILALFCGLMCLYEHHEWRVTKKRVPLWLSLVFLTLSVLANEGGVSGFAFILAYALVLEQGTLWTRLRTTFPAVRIIILWRIVYAVCELGPYQVGAYIDPSHEPLSFARELVPRALTMLAGQLPFLSPDLLFAVKPSLRPEITAIYCLLAVAFLLVFVPWVRSDKIAAFWFVAMLFAVIPASAVVPTTKNLGFVAVCAYGLIGSFVAGLVTQPVNWPQFRGYKTVARTACILLLLAHIPGAIAGRIVTSCAITYGEKGINYLCDFGAIPNAETKNVVIVNEPCAYPMAVAPFYRVYHQQALPASMHMLAPGCADLEVSRPDDRTLVIQSRARDLFSCGDFGFTHIAYAFMGFNLAIFGPGVKIADHYDRGCMTVDVLDRVPSGLPSRVAFHFNAPLDSTNFDWLRFDWPTFSYQPYEPPAIGLTNTLAGPQKIHGS